MNLADPLAQLGVGDLAARGNVLQALVVGGAGDLDMSQRFLTLRPATSFASMANSASRTMLLALAGSTGHSMRAASTKTAAAVCEWP